MIDYFERLRIIDHAYTLSPEPFFQNMVQSWLVCLCT